jgi:hypothetical protein
VAKMPNLGTSTDDGTFVDDGGGVREVSYHSWWLLVIRFGQVGC